MNEYFKSKVFEIMPTLTVARSSNIFKSACQTWFKLSLKNNAQSILHHFFFNSKNETQK